MTAVASTAPIATRRLGFDLSKPVLLAFATILFALIAIEDLHGHGLTTTADFVAEVIVVTVGLSVLLHGLTAGVIAARWPAQPESS